MSKQFMKMLGLFMGIALLSGCASKGVKVQSYFEQKPRVDQALTEGNQGYLMGSPSGAEADRKPTRQIFVVEVSKEADADKDTSYKVEKSSATTSSTSSSWGSSTITAVEASAPVVSSVTTATTPAAVEEKKVTYQDYKVDKDDTLQKISKKFYGNYNKWTKIYDANKSAIKNPDRIQPGITIRIPMEQ